MSTLTKQRNNAVDFFRLLCAIMVVGVHAYPLKEFGFWPFYFMKNIFPRIAVPFFFAIAGYYYIKSLTEGKRVFLSYMKKLLTVYTIWSIIYFALEFFMSVVRGVHPFSYFLKNIIKEYFFYGSSFQLWFFPALIFAVCVTSLAHKLKFLRVFAAISLPLYLIGCLGISYFKLGSAIPGLSLLYNWPRFDTFRRVVLMGLPFFLMGYYLNRFQLHSDRLSSKKLLVCIAFCILAFFGEIFAVIKLELHNGLVLTVFLYPLLFFVIAWLLRHPMERRSTLGSYARFAANFTYYAHPLASTALYYISDKAQLLYLPPTVKWLLMIAFGVIGGVLLRLINNKWLNKLVI